MGTLIINPYLIDSDAATYIAAVEAADGQTLEGTTKRAINDFVVGCKRDGIWDAIESSCILAGARTLTGALTSLKGTVPTSYNFVGADYDRKTGLKGNGSTKYLNTNKRENDYPRDNVSFGVYCSEFILGSTGSRVIGANSIDLNFLSVNNKISFRNRGNENSISTGRASGNFLGSTRGASSLTSVQIDNYAATYSISSVSYENNYIGVFVGLDDTGTPSDTFNASRVSFYFLGGDINLLLLKERVSQLMTDINNAF